VPRDGLPIAAFRQRISDHQQYLPVKPHRVIQVHNVSTSVVRQPYGGHRAIIDGMKAHDMRPTGIGNLY
jgi:hypothetical protein